MMPTSGAGNPHFTNDAERIFAYGDALQLFRCDGTDLKVHLRVTEPMPPGAGGAIGLDADLVARAAQQ